MEVISNLAPVGTPFKAFWTAKTINAVNGSRTTNNIDLVKGMVVVADPYNFDSAYGETNKPLNVATASDAAHQPYPAFLVMHVPPTVNDRVSGTQRRGGYVTLTRFAANEPALVEGTVAVGAQLIPKADGSGSLVAATAVNTVAAVRSYCAFAQEVNASGTNLRRVTFGI